MSVSQVSGHHHHGGGLSRAPASSTGSASASGTASSGAGASPFVGLQGDFAALMMQTQGGQQQANPDSPDDEAQPVAGSVSSSGTASASGSLSMAPPASGLLAGFLDPGLSGTGASASGSVTADSSSGSLGSGDVMGQMMKAIQAYAQQMLAGQQVGGVSV